MFFNALMKQRTAERRSRKRGVANYSPEFFDNKLLISLLQNGYFFILFISILFFFADYEITKEVNGFCPIKWFTVEDLFLLVVDTAETAIKDLFKSICNLNQVCGLSVPLKHLLCQKQSNHYFC